MTPKEQIVLDALTAAAAAGEPCPTNAELSRMIGAQSDAAASGYVRSLEQRGLIAVGRFARARRVTIVATQQSTAWPNNTAPHWRAGPQVGGDPWRRESTAAPALSAQPQHWCAQCDRRVSDARRASCQSRWCSLR